MRLRLNTYSPNSRILWCTSGYLRIVTRVSAITAGCILYRVMAQDNRAYKRGQPQQELSRSPETPESVKRQPAEDSQVDQIIHFPSDPAREVWRNAYVTQPHDPTVDYRPPKPAMIAPVATLSMKLLGAAAALLLFALTAFVLFHNWMTPAMRHPGEQKQTPGLLQRIP